MDKKILILDDEQDYIVALKDFFKEFEYAVEATMFPKHALEIISKEKPGLVLFDFKLPDMDGDYFFRKAKEISGRTKYILITAYKDEATIDKFRKMGVYDIVLKPIDLASLLEKVRSVLR